MSRGEGIRNAAYARQQFDRKDIASLVVTKVASLDSDFVSIRSKRREVEFVIPSRASSSFSRSHIVTSMIRQSITGELGIVSDHNI